MQATASLRGHAAAASLRIPVLGTTKWLRVPFPARPDAPGKDYFAVSAGRGAAATGGGGAVGWKANMRVMGLEPSPELIAIAMGAPWAQLCLPVCSRSRAAGGLVLGWSNGLHSRGGAYRRCWARSAVYFVQGILGLARLGVTYMYKDEFHLEPATVRPRRLLTVKVLGT